MVTMLNCSSPIPNQELRAAIPNVNLSYYINTDAVLAIEKSLGVALQPENQPRDEEIDEDDED